MKFVLYLLANLYLANVSYAHHYKGLPHYSYFENYPQIPVLEFVSDTPDYEIYTTVYNFQGLNLDQVESPDDVRFYTYIFDIKENKAYLGKIDFSISSHGKTILSLPQVSPEQESIYVIQSKFKEQDKLILEAKFISKDGKQIILPMKIKITETFFQKFGVYVSIALFFILVMGIKINLNRKEKNLSSN